MYQPREVHAAERATYYPYFDYLRAVAALGVFVSHADRNHILPSDLGNACVQVFFALSGFLIGGILLGSDRTDLPRFYYNRAVRIWIPYAIAIGILALVTAIKQGFSDPKVLEFFFYMVTFVYNWFGPPQLAEFAHRMPLDGTANHFWSICVEEQFYLVAPFFILFFNRAALLVGLACAALLSPGYFASISLGVLLALLGPSISLLALAFLGGVIGLYDESYQIAAPAFSVCIVGLLARAGTQTTFGKVVGGASYPFYLNHWIGLFAINTASRLGAPFMLSWLFGLVIAIAIGVAHYLIIDRAIASNRDRWFSARVGILVCVGAFGLVAIGFVGAIVYARR